MDAAHKKVADAINILDATCRAKSDDAEACKAAHRMVADAVGELQAAGGIKLSSTAAAPRPLSKEDFEMLNHLSECGSTGVYTIKSFKTCSGGRCAPVSASGSVFSGWDPSWYYPSWYSYVLTSPAYWNYWSAAPYAWRANYIDPWYWVRYY